MMTDDEIIAIAKATETAEPGTDGYILPVSFARAIENAVIIKLAGMQNALKDEIRLIWKPKCDALRQQLEAAQAEVARLIRDRDSVWALKEHKEVLLSQMTSERDAALARLAEIEADASTQPKMVTPYITQEHFDKAFPVNVPPSQAQPPAPGEAAITYMTGYSDGREWAKPSQALVVEHVYQYQLANGNWIDQTKESYDYNVKHGQATVRMLYATPQAAPQPKEKQ